MGDINLITSTDFDEKALQQKQCALIAKMYECFNEEKTFFKGDMNALGPKSKAAKLEYDRSVAELKVLLGQDAHCNSVDQDLWSRFSAFYESMNGFPPGRRFSVNDVNEWLFSFSA